MYFDVIEERMSSEKFIEFLEKLRSDANCPVFVIVIADNARYHHSKKVQALLEMQHREIMMAFLPAYSLELNPDEQVWIHAKADVGKRTIQSKDEMVKTIMSALQAIQSKGDLV
jgi:transposase